MKLTILTENTAGTHFLAEYGLSYLIEINHTKILFDTGQSDVFLKNAEKLGISIQNEVDKVILSHGHWDHGDGLIHLINKTLITHPYSFIKRFRKENNTPVGISPTIGEIESRFQIITSKKPIQLTKNLYYLGEIPRLNDFEAKTTNFIDEHWNEDFTPDDSALAAIDGEQIIIVTGCSHSGICNICEYAKMITGVSQIKAVIGGFHLKKLDIQAQKTISYFKKNQVERLHPSHCTELPVLSKFYREFNINTVKTGLIYDF